MHRFSLRLVRGDWYNWLLSSYLIFIFFFFVVRNLSYCFDSLRLLRLVTSSCCILNLISVLSWFHTLDLCSSATGTTSGAGRTVLIPGPKFRCGWWVWLILSRELILKCDFFCMYFCLIRLFTAGPTGCVGRTHITLFSVSRCGVHWCIRNL